jgi:hypothetical protein
MALLPASLDIDPSSAEYESSMGWTPQFNVDGTRVWAKHFAPIDGLPHGISVPCS